MHRFGVAFICLAPLCPQQVNGAIDLTVDPLQSQVNVGLCVSTGAGTDCDAGLSTVSGNVLLGLDCQLQPAAVRLRDFVFNFDDSVDLFLDFGFSGSFSATTNNVVVQYANPGTPLALVPLTNDLFSYDAVATDLSGTMSYDAQGLLCAILFGLGFNCTDNFDLTTFVLEPVSIEGELRLAGATAVIATFNVDIAASLFVENPGLANITVTGTVVATGLLPFPCCSGDLNADDTVDLLDLGAVTECLNGPTVFDLGACRCVDFNEDQHVDLRDIAMFFNNLE